MDTTKDSTIIILRSREIRGIKAIIERSKGVFDNVPGFEEVAVEFCSDRN